MTDAEQAAAPVPFSREAPGADATFRSVSPLVRRMVLSNPGPFTFTGTCCYAIGHGDVTIIDPGPDTAGSTERVLAALPGERVTHVLVTHTHRDHSPAAAGLAAATDALLAGCGPHHAHRAPLAGEATLLDASADRDYRPQLALAHGERLALPGGLYVEAVATPGHTMNHLCFGFPAENALFSGDHVMAWSTTVVAPPDGSMAAYMASLDALRDTDAAVFWPGHGGPVREPRRFVRALLGHRRHREAAILRRLRAGDRHVRDLVAALYESTPAALHGAAALSVFAHLEDLLGRGLVRADGPPTLDALWSLATPPARDAEPALATA